MSKGKQRGDRSKPAFDRRLGAVRIAIWENDSDDGTPWWNVSLVRRYKDGDDWKETGTFNGLADLALVKEAVNLAAAWITARETAVREVE